MQDCWLGRPGSRPDMMQVLRDLHKLLATIPIYHHYPFANLVVLLFVASLLGPLHAGPAPFPVVWQLPCPPTRSRTSVVFLGTLRTGPAPFPVVWHFPCPPARTRASAVILGLYGGSAVVGYELPPSCPRHNAELGAIGGVVLAIVAHLEEVLVIAVRTSHRSVNPHSPSLRMA